MRAWPPVALAVAGAIAIGAVGIAPKAMAQDAQSAKRNDDGSWRAGVYGFSDELGGFRILDVSGRGTRDDPAIVTQELTSASPVTLVIRVSGPIRPFSSRRGDADGFLHLRLDTRNASGLPWLEFGFELQEERGRGSVYGDGLSFDQRRQDSDSVQSTGYASHSADFEPFDRLLFTRGAVDPEAVVGFRFLISDFTPVREFYLVQDPRVPAS